MLKQPITQNILVDISNMIANAFARLPLGIDSTNTATGTNSVTIDGSSGVATFTTATSNGITEYTIYNSDSVSGTIVSYGLQYDGTQTSRPTILNYKTSTAGSIIFRVGALGVSDANLVIQFKIEN